MSKPAVLNARAHPGGAAMPMRRAPRIVAIGGGTGLPAVLRGLSDLFSANGWDPDPASIKLTGLVTVTDEGGSSGRLRRELGMLPPGDIRNCLVALADNRSLMTDLLQHRFTGSNGLRGHAVGNLILAALTQMSGDFARAVEQLSQILALRGRVLPSTQENVRIRAEFDCGTIIDGEVDIVGRGGRIQNLTLERQVRPMPEAIEALINADAIVVGPGSLYTSLLPNLLIDGIASTISGVNAARIYVANLMTEPGETDDFTLADHLLALRRHVARDLFDYILVNRRPIDPDVIAHYRERGSAPVQIGDLREFGAIEVVESDLATEWDGGKIRHATSDLARAILDLVERGRPPAR